MVVMMMIMMMMVMMMMMMVMLMMMMTKMNVHENDCDYDYEYDYDFVVMMMMINDDEWCAFRHSTFGELQTNATLPRFRRGATSGLHSTFCFTVLAPCFVLHAYHCALHLQDTCPYSSTHMFIVTLRPAVRLSTSKEKAFRDGAEGLSWQGYARPQSSAWCFFGEAVFIIRIIEYRSC